MEKKFETLKFYAERRNGKGELIERKQVGSARVCIIDNKVYGVNPRKYNELKRSLFEAFPQRRKGNSYKMVDESGRKDTFGGYPAQYIVWFE